jgi:hypothetical protein
MPLRLLLLSLALLSTPLFSRDKDVSGENCEQPSVTPLPVQNIIKAQNQITPKLCPNPGNMDLLCHHVWNKTKETDPKSGYNYVFQRIVYDASCVDYENESDEEIARKVNAMWNQYGAKLRCGPMGVPSTASPLRFAIHHYFDEFLQEALSMWKLDLNQLENGQTMLDFIDERISKTTGALKVQLESYRRSFVRMGAKKRSEL